MRNDDPHFNNDPFINAHDDAAEAKAKANAEALDPEKDETKAKTEANAAVDADTAEKAKHIGSQSDRKVTRKKPAPRKAPSE